VGRLRWAGLAAFVLCSLLVVAATRDNRHLRPDRAEMQALVGAPLSGPSYQSSSLAWRAQDRMRSWWRLFALPPPNAMGQMRLGGDVWTYTFPADSSYRPPAASPLRRADPARLHTYETQTGDGWRYYVWFDAERSRGMLAAQFVPPDRP
jgi:hypothetical protein